MNSLLPPQEHSAFPKPLLSQPPAFIYSLRLESRASFVLTQLRGETEEIERARDRRERVELTFLFFFRIDFWSNFETLPFFLQPLVSLPPLPRLPLPSPPTPTYRRSSTSCPTLGFK